MNKELLVKRASKISSGRSASPNVLTGNNRYLLIPGMMFTCGGSITGLLLGVDVRDRGGRVTTIDLWRPVAGGFSHVVSQTIDLTAGSFSPDGVFRYNLSMTINFQSGDVLGVHQGERVRFYYTMQGTPPVGYSFPRRDYNQFEISTTGRSRFSSGTLLLRPVTSEVYNIFKNLLFNNITVICYSGNDACLSGFLSVSDLKQQTLVVNINGVVSRPREQRLFPDIHFTCNGSITKWIVGAEMRTSGDVQPELQIWRRDSGGGNVYTRIRFNHFTSNATSDPNVHEYYPGTPLEFQEGDILGVYTPDSSKTQLVVYYQENTGPENYRQNRINPPAPSTFTAPGDLQYDYPLVTVEISTGNHLNVIMNVRHDFTVFCKASN